MAESSPDWYDVLKRLDGGDTLAYMELSQLVSGVLRQLRANDFRDDWGDMIQDVSMALVRAYRDGLITKDDAIGAYARQSARNRFRDRLRVSQRRHERHTLDINDSVSQATIADPNANSNPEDLVDLRQALERLPEVQRGLVWAVYGERKTYEEASTQLGVPLGSAKRHLAEGLRRLRARLAGEMGG